MTAPTIGDLTNATHNHTNAAGGGTLAISDTTGTLAVARGGTGATTLNDLITLGTHSTGNYVATVAGTTNEIEVSGSGSETAGVTIGLPDDVVITGNLTVNGTTTTVNSTTVTVDDPIFQVVAILLRVRMTIKIEVSPLDGIMVQQQKMDSLGLMTQQVSLRLFLMLQLTLKLFRVRLELSLLT